MIDGGAIAFPITGFGETPENLVGSKLFPNSFVFGMLLRCLFEIERVFWIDPVTIDSEVGLLPCPHRNVFCIVYLRHIGALYALTEIGACSVP